MSIERDCFGCAQAGRLVLRSDGTATFTEVGKARLGTVDKLLHGRIARAEFDAMAQLLLQRGFFQMRDVYEDPTLQDGAWIQVRATRADSTKEVFAREPSTPPELRAVETAMDALKRRIDFKP